MVYSRTIRLAAYFRSFLNLMNLTRVFRKLKSLFNVTQQGNAAQSPMPGIDIRFEIDGSDVSGRIADGLPVYGAFVHFRVFTS